MHDPAILAVGTATPAHTLTQAAAADEAAARCATDKHRARLLHRLYQTTAIERRGSVLTQAEIFFPPEPATRGPTTAQRMAAFERHAPPLAGEACRAALDAASLPHAAITHLLTVTCTGFASPGVEHRLISDLGLNPGVHRVQVGFMGCHAALNALSTAATLAAADSRHRILLCCVELCSLHFQYGWDEQKLVANALFADGAGAAIIGQRGGDDPLRIAGAASRIIDSTASEMTWTIGDHGFEMTLSPRVPSLIAEHLRPWIDDFLAQHGLTLPGVGGWCIHAGGPRIVSTVAKRLDADGPSIQTSRDILREHGNMSSGTILFILERMIRARLPRPWLMLAFGPGLTLEAVLLS